MAQIYSDMETDVRTAENEPFIPQSSRSRVRFKSNNMVWKTLFNKSPKTDDGRAVEAAEVGEIILHRPTAQEKSLKLRLDLFLLSFTFTSQVIKFLDQTNISTAYVNGMKEDLHLYGNELNYFTTTFTIGYAVGILPSSWFMTRVRPSIWLPCLEIIWGGLTGAVAGCNSAKGIYAIRVLLGLAEASAYPGAMYLLMNWYTPNELVKRIALYQSCQSLGSMMSSAIQLGIMHTLDGKGGLAGWRWTFVINCVMTMVVGTLGLFFIPDLPQNPNPRAFWLSKSLADVGANRLLQVKRGKTGKMTWGHFKKACVSKFAPVVWGIPILYTIYLQASGGSSFFSLWVKTIRDEKGVLRYNQDIINAAPLAASALNIVFVWIWGFASDWLKSRWLLIIAQAVIGIVPSAIFIASGGIVSQWVAWFMVYMSMGITPLLWGWASDAIPHDPELRSFCVSAAICMYYAFNSWCVIIIWPASQAPHYAHAWQVCLALWIAMIIGTIALRYYDIKFIGPENARISESLYGHGNEQEESQQVEDDLDKKAASNITIAPVLTR